MNTSQKGLETPNKEEQNHLSSFLVFFEVVISHLY